MIPRKSTGRSPIARDEHDGRLWPEGGRQYECGWEIGVAHDTAGRKCDGWAVSVPRPRALGGGHASHGPVGTGGLDPDPRPV